MTCDELRQDYTAYALGIADDPERSEIAAHLARECPACVPGIRSAMATVAVMSGAVPVKNPPGYLRRRVLASIRREPSRWRARCTNSVGYHRGAQSSAGHDRPQREWHNRR